MSKEVYTQIKCIRNYLGCEEVYQINKNKPNYRQLCSALDVASDINEAVCQYRHLRNCNSRGMNYIYIYGIINAIHAQTDAVKVIVQFFTGENLNTQSDHRLDIVRLIRNKVLAHASDRGNHFGIIADTMTSFSFQPHSFQKEYNNAEHEQMDLYKKVQKYSKGQYEGGHFTIDIQRLINEHQMALREQLSKVVEHLNKKHFP